MKKTKPIIVLSIVMAILLASLSSCSVLGVSSSLQSGGGESGDYMTREEVEKLLAQLECDVNVQGGDNYDITIEQAEGSGLAAAGKAILSVVSIKCNFNVTVSYSSSIFGPPQTYVAEQTAFGSGVIYSLDKDRGDAYVITNYHVVYCSGADTDDDISDDISLYLYGQEYEEYAIPAEYVGGSKNYDIAVLKVKGSNVLRKSNAIAANFADSNDTCVLDTAIAIGNPEAEGISATVGVVNVDSEQITLSDIGGSGYTTLRVMRIDAAVNGGNSGGGLFNSEGNLIGVVNAKMSDSTIDNIGYAIPSNIVKYVADNIIYYDNIDSNNDSVFRVMIGVTVGIQSAYTVYDTDTGKVHKVEDVKIESISTGSVAEKYLCVDDVVTSITVDGVDYEIIRTFNLVDVMLTARKESSIVFHVLRNGEAMDIAIDISSIQLSAY